MFAFLGFFGEKPGEIEAGKGAGLVLQEAAAQLEHLTEPAGGQFS
jgi:hypothetical protein